MKRRSFLRSLSFLVLGGSLSACRRISADLPKPFFKLPPGQTLARFPGKEELIMLTDRPPQLETPIQYFREDLTPNSAFFVRWHLAGIPTEVDLERFSLSVSGHVDNELSLTLGDLQKDFAEHSVVAVLQCSGNSRRYFEPPVAGGQWQNGAVGNARWTGVRLKDVLEKAGVKKTALCVSFAGLDEAPFSSTPKFVKSLSMDHALADDVLIAYKMNGEELPMLNGFPLRLVVPGWYATYWVKSLSKIEVLDKNFDGFWMEKAYRIPDNEFAEESPDKPAGSTVPISRLNLRSLFVRPDFNDEVKAGLPFEIEGLAFDAGGSIEKVEVAINGVWNEAKLDKNDMGLYSWRRWKYRWVPSAKGKYELKVRAQNGRGEVQTEKEHWNKSGYMRNVIEKLELEVT